MSTIATALTSVKRRIADAALHCGRSEGEITLLAVSKTKPAADLREAHAAGQRQFGESYLQEALAKQAQLADLPLEWHFIGPIQSNKTRPIAEHFGWVHSVDREKIAQRLSEQRPNGMAPLSVCLQVNVSGEASKSGAEPAVVPALARAIAALPRLKLRGLMAIPRETDNVAEQRAQFRMLRQLYEQLKQEGLPLDTLSMGMSHDLEAAIAEGATIVRIGSAIFGERERREV
jgi:hypothetical protein